MGWAHITSPIRDAPSPSGSRLISGLDYSILISSTLLQLVSPILGAAAMDRIESAYQSRPPPSHNDQQGESVPSGSIQTDAITQVFGYISDSTSTLVAYILSLIVVIEWVSSIGGLASPIGISISTVLMAVLIIGFFRQDPTKRERQPITKRPNNYYKLGLLGIGLNVVIGIVSLLG